MCESLVKSLGRIVQTNLPGTETSVSLSGLVLESDTHGVSRDKAPLSAASPMVSGMGNFEEVADFNCKLTVDTSNMEHEKAKQIISDSGGEFDNPNAG